MTTRKGQPTRRSRSWSTETTSVRTAGALIRLSRNSSVVWAQLRFVFRNVPLREMHPHAVRAAEAAEAAAAQDQFWEMHDTLFEHQWSLTDRSLLEYAAALGLDTMRFEQDLSARTHEPRVREDFRSGVRSGVNGTPTFFINGVRYEGSPRLPSLLRALTDASAAA